MYKGNFVQTVCWQTRPLAVSDQARGGEQTFHRYWCSRSWQVQFRELAQISASRIFPADIRLTKIRRLSRISVRLGALAYTHSSTAGATKWQHICAIRSASDSQWQPAPQIRLWFLVLTDWLLSLEHQWQNTVKDTCYFCYVISSFTAFMPIQHWRVDARFNEEIHHSLLRLSDFWL